MKQHRLALTVAAALIGGVALVGCKKEEPAPTPPPAPVATTPPPPMQAPAPSTSVTGVTLGKDQAVSAPTTSFATGDSTIYAAVATQTSDPAASVPGKLTAKWTHVDSNQTVAEESKDFSFAGPGTTTFNINNPAAWPPGKYRLEVSLDGSVVNTTDFEVK